MRPVTPSALALECSALVHNPAVCAWLAAVSEQLHDAAIALLVPWFDQHGFRDLAAKIRVRKYDGTFGTTIDTYKLIVGAFRSQKDEKRALFRPLEIAVDNLFFAFACASMRGGFGIGNPEALLALLRDATALSLEQLEAEQAKWLVQEQARAAERANRATLERASHEKRLREAAAAQREKEELAAQRLVEARAHDRRPRSCGVISNLTPKIEAPHNPERCGYADCVTACATTVTCRAPRTPAVIAWMAEQIATLPSDVVGFVRLVPNQIEHGPRRAITPRLLVTQSPNDEHWDEWSACSVVDLIAEGGTLVVLTDTDERGHGERAAIALAQSRGIHVDVRRAPC